MFNRSGSPSNSLSFPPSLNSIKKRKRHPSECDERPAASISDGKRVPRRIDPDRLAIRLGPELVGEMDAYIVPGAKMPSFQVRQQFVKKYNVDRRHIYDYFHSRGLRVAKEDKHLNLSHRMRKPAASRKPATSQVTSLDDVNLVESPTVSDPPPMDSAISAPTSDTNSVLPPTNLVKSTKGSSKRRVIASSPPAPVKTSISPLLPSLDSMDLSSDSSDSEGGKSPIFDITDTLTASSSFGEDLDLLSLGYSVSDDKLRESFGPDFTPFPPALPEDPLFELYELQHDIPQTSSKPVSVRDSLLPLDDLSRLSENDRIEFYNLVNAGIGPAQDIIEECAGTYKAHMERLYFNRFYPGAQPRSRSQPDAPCYLAARAVIFTRPATIAEKENINPSASRTFIDPQPSNNHYYRQTVVPVSPLRRRNSHYLPLSPRREQPPIPANAPAVKSFVPPIVNNADKITSAIAIRSSRDTILHDHPTPLIWTSPVTSASSQWQAQMTQALTRSNPFAIPTFYSPCGDRIIYQPKSIP